MVNHHVFDIYQDFSLLVSAIPSFILKYVKANQWLYVILLLQNNGENDHFSLTFSHWPGLITLKHSSYRKVRFNASFSPLIANCQSEVLYTDDILWGPRRMCVCVAFWFLLLLLWPLLFVWVPLWTHKPCNIVSIVADVIDAPLFISRQHTPFLNEDGKYLQLFTWEFLSHLLNGTGRKCQKIDTLGASLSQGYRRTSLRCAL